MTHHKTLQERVDFERNNPIRIQDYCYYDGGVTYWRRGEIIDRANGRQVRYSCEECATKRHYNIKTKEERDERAGKK